MPQPKQPPEQAQPESKPAESQPQPEQQDEQTKGDPGPGSLKEGQEVGEEVDAEAPGPITPEHESGSWEQTLAERERREGKSS